MSASELSILWPALLAGLLVSATHVPLGTQVLARGYAVVRRRQDGSVVHRVSQARGNLAIRVSDGEFDAEVKKNPNL